MTAWDDTAGYELDDPKHPDYADRVLEDADRRRKAERESSEGEPKARGASTPTTVSTPARTPDEASSPSGNTLAALTKREQDLEDELSIIYQELRPLRVQIAELRGPVELPHRRYRTETQNRVARCPRCGEKVE